MAPAWLIALPGGSPLDPIEIRAAAKAGVGFVVGRSKECDFQFPAAIESVSRKHAQFVGYQGKWRITDLGSRWGTAVNGMRIPPHHSVPLCDGDLIGIHPWTFRFSTQGSSAMVSLAIDEDSGRTIVHTLGGDGSRSLRHDLLNLLLEASSAIQSAPNEAALAGALADIARRGTGFANAAVLRAVDAQGGVEAMTAASAAAVPIRFSRSLLAAAAKGVVAEFAAGAVADVAQSIAQSDIRAAICAPLMTDGSVAAYLYLDWRGPDENRRVLGAGAAAFCQALARMGGLAMTNLRRVETERRAVRLEAELNSAAEAQRWIIPRAPICAGPFTCAGRSRPGGYLGGDFFDAQVLSDGRLAVCLGDVSGHGAAAGILMSAAQGFLHASLHDRGDLEQAIAGLNGFVEHRRPTDKFMTLWVGLLDPAQMTLRYIDAGHGLALLLGRDGSPRKLDENGGPPIGVDAAFEYRQAALPIQAGDRLLIVSDGIVEQWKADSPPEAPAVCFGLEGVQAAVRTAGNADLLDHLFGALAQFAGCSTFADDATAVLVR